MALASVGVYGIISLQMSQRMSEMGLRVALGARRGDILKLVLGTGLYLVATGLVIGGGCSWIVSRATIRLLIGVTNSDPLTYATATCVLLFAALLACYLPARRAVRVDPMVTLRHE